MSSEEEQIKCQNMSEYHSTQLAELVRVVRQANMVYRQSSEKRMREDLLAGNKEGLLRRYTVQYTQYTQYTTTVQYTQYTTTVQYTQYTQYTTTVQYTLCATVDFTGYVATKEGVLFASADELKRVFVRGLPITRTL